MMKSLKQVKKTKTFRLEKSTTMEQYQFTAPSDQYSTSTATTFVTKKSPPPVEFPTSPQLIFGEEILHFSHPQHPLSMMDLPDLFNCVGCKEYGSGKRFVCKQCDFQMHDFCALAPPALKAHPIHSQHSILFHSKPAKVGKGKPKCDVCGKPTKGFAFLCTACAFQMHPCCAMLSTEIEYPPHPHTLRVAPTTAPDPASFVCGECRSRRSGKVYRCTACEYNLHAVCAKSKINGLYANGIKPPEKQSVLAAAAKVASQVVIEFIGGLVEGIGESVGDVLVQNIAKGSNAATNAGPKPRYK
ncbi:protein-disulfide reductase [Spatholobus suberectus]|nr:protein-disulfide reductase [Spatholobus suberectus]